MQETLVDMAGFTKHLKIIIKRQSRVVGRLDSRAGHARQLP